MGKFGKTYSYSRAQEGDGEYHHIHYGDIHVKYTGFITRNTIVPSLSVQGEFELLKENDVVIADASEDYVDLGKTIIIQQIGNKKIIAGLHTFKFTPNENLNSKFYLYYSQTNLFKKFSYKTGTGISVFGISKANIKKMQLNIPKQEEQQKIGDFFKHLDQMISLEQRKLEKMKALKSAYLTEMFPSEGEKVPKRRFAGFTDEWKEFELGDLGVFKSNGVNKKINVNEKRVSLLNYMDVYSRKKIKSANTHELMQITAKDNQIIENGIERNDVFFTPSSETSDDIGRVLVIEETLPDTVYSYHLMRYRPYRNIFYSIFPNYCFTSKKIRNQMKLSAQGVQRFVLNKNSFDELRVLIPNIEEQKLIAIFFKKLDDKITNQQQKLDKLKAMKQAYLEEMFV